MIFLIDEYADLLNHSSNKQTSSSAGMSDKDLEDMVGSPYGYTPGQDSIRTDAQLTTGKTPLDIQSTGTLFASYGELGVQQILGNAMNFNAPVSASSLSLQTMTDYAASFASSGRGGGGDSKGAVVVGETGDVFQVERGDEVISTPTLDERLSTLQKAGSAPAALAGSARRSLSKIRQSIEARRRGEKLSRTKRNLMGATKNYTFDARSNKDFG